MRRTTRHVLTFASLLLAGSAFAQVTDFRVDIAPGITADGSPAVANALVIAFDGQYTGSQLLLELCRGSILNVQAFGSNVDTAPVSGLLAAVPGLAFDTYLAQGALRADDPGAAGTPNLGGGAVGISAGETTAVFNDAAKISQTWNPVAGADIRDRDDFVVANIALSPDAAGTLTYLAAAGGEFFITPASVGIIRDGVVAAFPSPQDHDCIPEPATAGLLALGIAVLARRRAA